MIDVKQWIFRNQTTMRQIADKNGHALLPEDMAKALPQKFNMLIPNGLYVKDEGLYCMYDVNPNVEIGILADDNILSNNIPILRVRERSNNEDSNLRVHYKGRTKSMVTCFFVPAHQEFVFNKDQFCPVWSSSSRVISITKFLKQVPREPLPLELELGLQVFRNQNANCYANTVLAALFTDPSIFMETLFKSREDRIGSHIALLRDSLLGKRQRIPSSVNLFILFQEFSHLSKYGCRFEDTNEFLTRFLSLYYMKNLIKIIDRTAVMSEDVQDPRYVIVQRFAQHQEYEVSETLVVSEKQFRLHAAVVQVNAHFVCAFNIRGIYYFYDDLKPTLTEIGNFENLLSLNFSRQGVTSLSKHGRTFFYTPDRETEGYELTHMKALQMEHQQQESRDEQLHVKRESVRHWLFKANEKKYHPWIQWSQSFKSKQHQTKPRWMPEKLWRALPEECVLMTETGLYIRNVPQKNLGLFCLFDLNASVNIARFNGRVIINNSPSFKNEYALQIMENQFIDPFPDGGPREPNSENIAAFINEPGQNEVANVCAIKSKRKRSDASVDIVTCRRIIAHTEITLYYGERYARNYVVGQDCANIDENHRGLDMIHFMRTPPLRSLDPLELRLDLQCLSNVLNSSYLDTVLMALFTDPSHFLATMWKQRTDEFGGYMQRLRSSVVNIVDRIENSLDLRSIMQRYRSLHKFSDWTLRNPADFLVGVLDRYAVSRSSVIKNVTSGTTKQKYTSLLFRTDEQNYSVLESVALNGAGQVKETIEKAFYHIVYVQRTRFSPVDLNRSVVIDNQRYELHASVLFIPPAHYTCVFKRQDDYYFYDGNIKGDIIKRIGDFQALIDFNKYSRENLNIAINTHGILFFYTPVLNHRSSDVFQRYQERQNEISHRDMQSMVFPQHIVNEHTSRVRRLLDVEKEINMVLPRDGEPYTNCVLVALFTESTLMNHLALINENQAKNKWTDLMAHFKTLLFRNDGSDVYAPYLDFHDSDPLEVILGVPGSLQNHGINYQKLGFEQFMSLGSLKDVHSSLIVNLTSPPVQGDIPVIIQGSEHNTLFLHAVVYSENNDFVCIFKISGVLYKYKPFHKKSEPFLSRINEDIIKIKNTWMPTAKVLVYALLEMDHLASEPALLQPSRLDMDPLLSEHTPLQPGPTPVQPGPTPLQPGRSKSDFFGSESTPSSQPRRSNSHHPTSHSRPINPRSSREAELHQSQSVRDRYLSMTIPDNSKVYCGNQRVDPYKQSQNGQIFYAKGQWANLKPLRGNGTPEECANVGKRMAKVLVDKST